MKPEISVIMSVYNGETYLAEAVESVINQTFANFELVVINDCSNEISSPRRIRMDGVPQMRRLRRLLFIRR